MARHRCDISSKKAVLPWANDAETGSQIEMLSGSMKTDIGPLCQGQGKRQKKRSPLDIRPSFRQKLGEDKIKI